jgi:hypothetical protein
MLLLTRVARLPLVLLFLAIGVVPGRADVIYKFVGTGINFQEPPLAMTFQLTVPTFINPSMGGPIILFGCSALDFSSGLLCPSNSANAVQFSNQPCCGPFTAKIVTVGSNNTGYDFSFLIGRMSTPGTYESNGAGFGTLTVTAVPESSELLLLLAGLGSIGLFRLRRNHSSNITS